MSENRSSRSPSLPPISPTQTTHPSVYRQLAETMKANEELKPIINGPKATYIGMGLLRATSPADEVPTQRVQDQNEKWEKTVVLNRPDRFLIKSSKPQSPVKSQPTPDPSTTTSQVYQRLNKLTDEQIFDKEPTGEDLKKYTVIRKTATTQVINDLAYLSRNEKSQNVTLKIDQTKLIKDNDKMKSEIVKSNDCNFKLHFTVLLARSSLLRHYLRSLSRENMSVENLLLQRSEKNGVGIILSGENDKYELKLDIDEQNEKVSEYQLALNELRSYLYTGSCGINKTIDFQLFTLAIAFKIPSLIEYLDKRLQDELDHGNFDRVFDILEFSWKNFEESPALVGLKKKCINFINSKGLKAIYNKEYQKIADTYPKLVMEMFFENK